MAAATAAALTCTRAAPHGPQMHDSGSCRGWMRGSSGGNDLRLDWLPGLAGVCAA